MDVCAVFVTYNPDSDFPAHLHRARDQVGAVVIVDNGSDDAGLLMLRAIAAEEHVAVVFNPENLGIARALNIGIEQASNLGFSWVLLLDQDSQVSGSMVRTLCDVQAAFPAREELAVVGSGFRELDAAPIDAGGEAQGTAPVRWDEVEWVITSGSLLSLAAYAKIGLFREEFFMDFIDTDFCLRARRHGYRVIKTQTALMSHAIGSPTQHRLLWKRKWTSNHSADRRYYRARNQAVMLREYGTYRWGGWAFRSFSSSFRTCKRIALYEDMKLSKIMAVAQGWWDGVRGRLGRRDGRWSSPKRLTEISAGRS
jgi:rhamnosyltransferase